jgi:hypothetical protein
LTSNYAICSIVIVAVGDTNKPDETKLHIRNREIDIYEEITKIVQKRATIAYLTDSYTESYIDSSSYIKSFLEKGTSSTKPIPIIRR